MMYVYSEIYNLAYNSCKSEPKFTARLTIQDADGLNIKSIDRNYKKVGTTCALSLRINVDKLDIDRITRNDFKEYQIWEYNNLNLRYVFVDEQGFGEYRILDSNRHALDNTLLGSLGNGKPDNIP